MKPASNIFFTLSGLVLIVPLLDATMMSRDRPMAGIQRLLRRRAMGRTPNQLAWGLVGFCVAVLASVSFTFVAAVCAAIAAWVAVVGHRVVRAERLFRHGAATNGRITSARLERHGLELDYTFDAIRSSHRGTIVVTDALVAASVADYPTVFVFYETRHPWRHVALLARELDYGWDRRPSEP